MRPTAIAFDLDWTLSYYPLSSADVTRQAFALIDMPEPSMGFEAMAVQFNALWVETERQQSSTHSTRKAVFQQIFEEASDAFLEKLARAYDEIRRESGVRLYPGALELLAALRARYRLGLLTNGATEMQWEKLRILGIESLFDAIIVAGDHGIYKPSKDVFELLADRLGCPVSEILFVGDNYEADVRGAHEAGLASVWLRHPGTEPSGTPCHDHVIDTIAQLKDCCL